MKEVDEMKEKLIERLREAALKKDVEHLLICFRVLSSSIALNRHVVGDKYSMDCLEALNEAYIEERQNLY
jgi:hypothetical protein